MNVFIFALEKGSRFQKRFQGSRKGSKVPDKVPRFQGSRVPDPRF
jgi:hypothetical protein